MNALPAWRDLPTALDGVALSHGMREGDRPILMVHGIGPGTTGRANFGPLLNRLPPPFAPHLIDLAGFGASGRLPAPPYFDVPFWLRQIDLAIDRIVEQHGRPPLLIGNSVGGALALKAAARRPELRRVLAIGAPAGGPAPLALRAFWTAPKDAESLAAQMQPMTFAATRPDPDLVRDRLQPFLAGDYGAYFAAMLADPDACLKAVALTPAEAAGIGAQVTLMHGRHDLACLLGDTLNQLAPLLPDADLVLLGECGHNVIAERPADVFAAIVRIIEKTDLQ